MVRVFQIYRVNKDLWRESHLNLDSYENPMLGTSSGFLQGLFGILPHLFSHPWVLWIQTPMVTGWARNYSVPGICSIKKKVGY